MITFHIVLAMKPISGNFAQNAIEHGVAGLNIDAGRIAVTNDRADYEEKRRSFDGTTGKVCGDSFVKNASPLFSSDVFIERSKNGRFPANLILQHSSGCELSGTKKVESTSRWTYQIPKGGGLGDLDGKKP